MKSGLICLVFLSSMFIHQAYAQTGQNATSSTNGTNIQNTTQTSNEMASSNAPTLASQTTPQNVEQTASQTTPQNVEQTANQTTPQNVDQTASQTTPQNVEQTASQKTPQNVDQTASQTTPQNVEQTASQKTPQNVDQTASQTTPQNVAQTASQTTPQNVVQQDDQKAEQNTKKQSNEGSSANTITENQTVEQPKKSCPLWKCDSDMPKEWCYKYDASDQSIHAANILKNESSCYILNYFETGEQSLKKDKQGYPLNATNYFQSLSDTLCKNRDWQNQARCQDFCVPRLYEANVADESGKIVLKNLTDFSCAYDQYLKSHSHSRVGLREWEECDYDKQCSSNHCECVPNSKSTKGRCTTSVYDDEYRYFWKHVCQDKDVDRNWERNTCEDFLQILYAHITEALDEDDDLPCLQTFSDFDSLIKLHDELESFSQVSIIGWVIAGVVTCIIICVVCGASQKEKIKEEYEKFKKSKSKKKPLLQQTEAIQA